MKIVFIHQAPHRLHAAWLKSITDKIYPCVPDFIFNRKKIYDFVYKHTLLNQALCLVQGLFIPNADIYVVEGLKTALPAILRKKKGTKIILINSDTFFYNYKQANFIIKYIYKKYLNFTDGMISTSFFMKKMAEQYSKVPNVVVYPFADQKFSNIRANMDNKNIIFTGRIIKDKGVPLLIRIVNDLDSKYIDKLYLVGNIDEKIDELKTKNNRVVMTGWTDHVEEYLKKSSIYVNLANHESFGVGILEAMTAGVIPIVTEYCGIKEIIKPISEKLVCERNVLSVSRAIKWIQSGNKNMLSKQCKLAAEKLKKGSSIKEFKEKFNSLCMLIDK